MQSVKGISIHRVSRIYNRFVRNRFEEKVESLLDMTKPGFKKSFEFLFLSIDANNQTEFFNILEKGCISGSKSGTSQIQELYSTVYGADNPRCMKAVESQKQNYQGIHEESAIGKVPGGTLLVCKVIMINSIKDNINPTFDLNTPFSEIQKTNVPSSELIKQGASTIMY